MSQLWPFWPVKITFKMIQPNPYNFLIDRATQEVFEIYAIELLGSLPTDEAWRRYQEYIDLPRVCIHKFVMIHWILQ